MKVKTFLFTLLALSFFAGCNDEDSTPVLPQQAMPFEIELRAITNSDSMRVAIEGGWTESITVDWGDGSTNTYSKGDKRFTHNYAIANKEYNIRMTGKGLETFGTGDNEAGLIQNIKFVRCPNLNGVTLINMPSTYKFDFTNCHVLKSLSIFASWHESIDLSAYKKIEMLYLGNNERLRELRLPTELNMLKVTNARSLNVMDVTGLNKLTSFTLSNTNIASLDFSKLFNMDWLVLEDNKFTSLDLSALTRVSTIICRRNLLQHLRMGNHPNLTHLNAESNNLTSVDLSTCEAMVTIVLTNNELTDVILPNSSSLRWLSCGYNELSTNTINRIFDALPSVNEGQVYVPSNPGSADCNTSIATKKKWTVSR